VRVTNIEPGMAQTEFSDIRFKGDKAKADAVYANSTPLSKEDIANTIFTLAELPAHVNVNTIEIMPTVQSYGGLVVEKY